MSDEITYSGTHHTARLIGAHHNLAGMWEASYIPGHALTEQDAKFAITIADLAATGSGPHVVLARTSTIDFAERNGISMEKIAANLTRPATFYMAAAPGPVSGSRDYVFFLQRDIYDGDRPAFVVAWEVWFGGYREISRWTWDAPGLAAAGVWALKHRARSRLSGHTLFDAGELLASADTPVTWQTERDHKASAPIVTCDQDMRLTYKVDCSCGQWGSSWLATEALVRREWREHQGEQVEQARAVVRAEVERLRLSLAGV